MFLVNSRYPRFRAPRTWLPRYGALFSRSYEGNLPSSFTIVLSSALVCSTSPPVSVSGTVYKLWVLSWKPSTSPANPTKAGHTSDFVTHGRPRTINLVPIGYGFRPRLRGRLTLRGLALRRNPWTSGESVSHTLCRYSCQHSRFRYLQQSSQITFTGLRNAPLPIQKPEDRNQKARRRSARLP